MDRIAQYLDGVEAQIRRDGFMTHTLRRHLHQLSRVTADAEAGRRINDLVARFNMPYALPEAATEALMERATIRGQVGHA